MKNSRQDHFGTSHLKADLKGRSVRSGAVTIAGRAAGFVLTTLSTVILARLLVPADFGLVAMCSSLLVFLFLFQHLSLAVATIQRDHVSHEQASTLFWINVALATAISLVAIAISPLVAWLYGESRLTALTMGMTIPVFIGGFAAQHSALLARQMRFATEQSISIASALVGIGTAILFAFLGAGYWALVYQQIASTFVTLVLVWVSTGWIPGRPKRGTGVASMVQYGAFLTGSGLFHRLAQNVDNILIGTTLGATSLGLYSKAYGLLLMPIKQINEPVGRVAIPSLSRLQNDPDRFRSFYCRGIEILTFCGMPIVVFCFVAADEIVLIMLGDQWGETVRYFRALAPAALTGTFASVATFWLYAPLGRSKQQFVVTAAASIVTVIAFCIGIRWGAIGVAYAFSLITVVKIIPELYLASYRSPVRLMEILRSLARPFVAALVAGIIVWYLKPRWAVPDAIVIDAAISSFAFLLVYLCSVASLPGGRRFVSQTMITIHESFFQRASKSTSAGSSTSLAE